MKLRKSLLILSASAILSAAVIAPDVALAQPFPGPPPGGGLAGPASPVVPPGHGAAGIADDMVRKWIEFKASAGVDKSDLRDVEPAQAELVQAERLARDVERGARVTPFDYDPVPGL